MERIYPNKTEIKDTLEKIRLANHIQRYQLIKRYLYGNVLDIACGVGYGCELISNVPDIKKIYGVDRDNESINYAHNTYKNKKIEFSVNDIKTIKRDDIDCLVSLETIEHLLDTNDYSTMVKRIRPELIVVSYPNKKSTHFNKFHFQDLCKQDIVDLLPDYHIVRQEKQQYDVSILVLVKNPENMPKHVLNNYD